MKGQSIQKRLLLAVLISQVLLALGLTCAGALYTRRRVMASLDESLRAHATSIAALVRFPEDGSKRLLFDQSLAPKSVDGVHSDVYRVSARALGIVENLGINCSEPKHATGNLLFGPAEKAKIFGPHGRLRFCGSILAEPCLKGLVEPPC